MFVQARPYAQGGLGRKKSNNVAYQADLGKEKGEGGGGEGRGSLTFLGVRKNSIRPNESFPKEKNEKSKRGCPEFKEGVHL